MERITVPWVKSPKETVFLFLCVMLMSGVLPRIWKSTLLIGHHLVFYAISDLICRVWGKQASSHPEYS